MCVHARLLVHMYARSLMHTYAWSEYLGEISHLFVSPTSTLYFPNTTPKTMKRSSVVPVHIFETMTLNSLHWEESIAIVESDLFKDQI